MSNRNYSLAAPSAVRLKRAPELPYQPPRPKRYAPKIGMIGCGGISSSHLDAYRTAGWEVVAFCSRTGRSARQRRKEFFPNAEIFRDYQTLLRREDIDVVDIALHPEERPAAIAAALRAGKHVLSQKPFVLDLGVGERLVALAEKRGLKLAVNQNGRWAPYFSYAAQAIRAGLIGQVHTVSMNLNWDHTWIKDTPYEAVHDVVLYDFAIHWFDAAALFFSGRKPWRIFAATELAPTQQMRPPMIGSAVVQFEGGTATLSFDAHSRFGPRETLSITGSTGTIHARGPICAAHDLTLHTAAGWAKPKLKGKWFNDGFRGAMGELLCAIEEDREPSNCARENLLSLALCFAAVQSARAGKVQIPGAVRRLPSHRRL
jgi:predicted dehydrogenase